MVVIASRSKQQLKRQKAPHAPRKRSSLATKLNASATAKRARKRRTDMQTCVANLDTLLNGLIQSSASNISVKPAALRAQVLRSYNVVKKRRPNTWNGFLRKKALEANSNLPVGHKLKVRDIVTEELREQYQKLSEEERKSILAEHTDYVKSNTTGSYITDKSDHHAALAKFNQIKELAQSLQHQHDVHLLVVAVRGSSTSYFKTEIVSTPEVQNFWTLAGHEEPYTWASRLEAFVIGGVSAMLEKDTHSALSRRGQIRSLLGQKLVAITGDAKATMAYARYEQDIVAKYGVVLEGWPFPVIRNLADESASNSDLTQLYHRLVQGQCFFRKLTETEIQDRAASAPAANTSTRKPRSDKGHKRGPQRATVARQAMNSNNHAGTDM